MALAEVRMYFQGEELDIEGHIYAEYDKNQILRANVCDRILPFFIKT